MTSQLPFVSDKLLTRMSNTKMDFQEVVNDLADNNPHLLDYILGFTKYIENETNGFTKKNVFNFGLSIYLALKEASKEV